VESQVYKSAKNRAKKTTGLEHLAYLKCSSNANPPEKRGTTKQQIASGRKKKVGNIHEVKNHITIALKCKGECTCQGTAYEKIEGRRKEQ